MVTAAPARVSAVAMARPMPRPPPVTSACFPSSEAIFKRIHVQAKPLQASCAENTLGLNFSGFKYPLLPPSLDRLGKALGGAHEDSRRRRRTGRALLRHPDEEGVAADADHRVRAQQAGRHVRLRRRVLRPDAGRLRIL